MSLTASEYEHGNPAKTVLQLQGTISRALADLEAAGGPGLDIPALAEQVDVPAGRLYQLDQGQLGFLQLAELERLCRILGRSPNDILGYEADL
jgi:DNA-binding Xre family transcriptional regulator